MRNIIKSTHFLLFEKFVKISKIVKMDESQLFGKSQLQS